MIYLRRMYRRECSVPLTPGIGFWRGCAAFLLLLGALIWPDGAKARDPVPTADGTCVGADFHTAWNGASELPVAHDQYRATVLRAGAVLYADNVGAKRKALLPFNSKVFVRAADYERLGVALEGERSVAGWVRRADLLCARTPLEGRDNRLGRMVVVSRLLDDSGSAGMAFPDPEMRQCLPACRQLTRFRLYFVAAETEEAVLLAESPILRSFMSVLVGWVGKREVVEWSTRLGVRGAKGVAPEGGRPICGYLTLDALRAKRPETCQEIARGPVWFQTENRLLVVAVNNDHYEVLGPVGDRLRRLFVAIDEDVEIDVLLRLAQLEAWTDLFRRMIDTGTQADGARAEFIRVLLLTLRTVADGRAPRTDMKLADYMREAVGLPMGMHSAMLDYSIEDLLDVKRVPDCEIVGLIAWAKASRQMLKWAQSGDKLAAVDLQPLGATGCRVSPAGQRLRVSTSPVEGRPLDGTSTIRWQMFNDTFYWVPQDYLP